MPAPFIILGLIVMYLLFYTKKSVGVWICTVGLLTLMLGYIVPNVELNNVTSVNVMCLLGLIILCVACVLICPQSARGSLLAVLTIGALYIVLFRVDNDYYSVFNITPLILTILTVCMVLCKSTYGAIFMVIISNIFVEVINVFVASIEGLYAVMFSTQIVMSMIVEISVLLFIRLLLHFVKVVRYAKK